MKNNLESAETPFYLYNLPVLRATLEACKTEAAKYGYHVHYALKANSNPTLLSIIKEHGFGADCVSGGELQAAVDNGFSASDIVFAGVGKSDREITFGLDHEIFCFNVESVEELQVLNSLAEKSGKKATIALRINPNVNAHTHHYITTGLEENKFGINHWELSSIMELLPKLKNLQFIGLHFHIGSQITDLEVFKNLCNRINEFVQLFEERNFSIQVLNVGGGLGIDYTKPDEHLIPNFEAYFSIFHKFLHCKPNTQVHFELGRSLVAQCGSLISKVLYKKEGLQTKFLILDAGMTELLRPALYQAYHKIENISKLGQANTEKYDVVGPICESSDCFGKAVELPASARGDLIAIRSAGAYGEVMRSNYNLRISNKAVFIESELAH